MNFESKICLHTFDIFSFCSPLSSACLLQTPYLQLMKYKKSVNGTGILTTRVALDCSKDTVQLDIKSYSEAGTACTKVLKSAMKSAVAEEDCAQQQELYCLQT